jgi:hypothetical protein
MTIGLCLLLLLLLAKQMCARLLSHDRRITGAIADPAEYKENDGSFQECMGWWFGVHVPSF